jgi:putative transposase
MPSPCADVVLARWSVSTAPPNGYPPPLISDEEALLRAFLREFSRARPRWGWRRAAKAARRAGWQVNDKRIRQLWRAEGLKVPQRTRKKRLSGIGTHVGAMCPIRPDALWACDFQFDVTADGRTLKLLNIIDEFTREALAIEVDRSIDADKVVTVLDRLVAERGRPPAFLRFDNGPEFIAHAVADWSRFNGGHRVHRPRLALAERLDRVVQRPAP